MAITATLSSANLVSTFPSVPKIEPPPGLPKPLAIAIGAFWGAFWAVDAHSFVSSLTVKTKPEDTATILKRKEEEKKKRLENGISLAKTTACALSWADSVEWISLGKAASWLSGFAAGATVFLSGRKIKQSYQEYQAAVEKEKTGSTDEQEIAKHRQRALLFRLAEHVAYVAWAVIEIVSLVIGTALCPVISGLLLFGSLAFGVADLIYDWEIKKMEKKDKAEGSTLALAASKA